MIVMVPYSIIMDMNEGTVLMATTKAIVKLIGCATLLQSLTGSSYTSHALNAVCWFLSSLFICYILCPFFSGVLISVKKKCRTVHVILCTFAVWIWLVILDIIQKLAVSRGLFMINDLVYGSPFARLFIVLLGMIIAKNLSDMKRRVEDKIYGDESFYAQNHVLRYLSEILIIVLILAWYFNRNRMIEYFPFCRLLDLFVCELFIILMIQRGIVSKILSFNTIVIIGRNSWKVFLWHYPVICYVDLLFHFINANYWFGNNAGLIELFSALIVIVAIVNIQPQHNK